MASNSNNTNSNSSNRSNTSNSSNTSSYNSTNNITSRSSNFNNNLSNLNNNLTTFLMSRRRRQRQFMLEYMRNRMILPLPRTTPLQMPMVMMMTTSTVTSTMTTTRMRAPRPMRMPVTLPMLALTIPLLTQIERFGTMRHRIGSIGNEGQAGDVGNIGDSNHVVGIPTVAPANHMAHMGGGDAEIMFEVPLAPQHQGAGDGMQRETEQGQDVPQQQQVIRPPRRETLEQRHERSVQAILGLCAFIRQQLAEISNQIDEYERKLPPPNGQSPSPPEPDDDLI